jgi:glutaryl-CoA dehydrogenase
MTPDYLLDELLSDEARAVRDRVRAFVESDVLPVINDYWDRAEFPWALVPKLAGLGVVGSTIEGYGCPGLSPLAAGMATLEMSRGDGSVNTFLGVQSGLAMGSINLLGRAEQKERWLPRMAALELIGVFALTEPNHGSDSVALETSVRRDGDTLVLKGPSDGSATPASPTWSSCGPATPTTTASRPSSSRRTRRHLPRRLHRRGDHRQDRQARGVAARRHPA